MLGAEGALVSVVMPTYNCADFIEESIRSVQGQTHGEWELIVIDDCSTDDTRERVERIAASDPRVHYHLLESNSGAAVARTLEAGRSLGRVLSPKKRADYNAVLLTCPIGNSTVLYDADALGKFVVPNIRKRNDDALWLQMLKKEKYILGMPDVLMSYRVRANSISANKLSLIRYHWILYRDIEHLSIARSAAHIGVWVALKALRIK